MEIRKKLGAKKAEKSLEISAFLVFSRSDLNRPKDLAGAEGLRTLLRLPMARLSASLQANIAAARGPCTARRDFGVALYP